MIHVESTYLFIRHICGCPLPTLRNTETAPDNHEENADNSKDHEDYQSSMTKLYQQENVVFIAWRMKMALNIKYLVGKVFRNQNLVSVSIRPMFTCKLYEIGARYDFFERLWRSKLSINSK